MRDQEGTGCCLRFHSFKILMMLDTVSTTLEDPRSNLIELLRHRAWHQPAHIAYAYLEQGEAIKKTLTYAEIDLKASLVASYLQETMPIGSRVLLVFPNHPDFIIGFMGCLYGGIVAVPVAPPQNQQNLPRFSRILESAGAIAVLTAAKTYQHLSMLGAPSEIGNSVRWLILEELLQDPCQRPWQLPSIDANTLVLLQYTSGSTGDPKGVMVSHGNLLNNFKMLHHGFDSPLAIRMVTWLPFFHDWGLIGCLLYPLYVEQMYCIFFEPSAFLYQPLRWLKAISQYRATISCAPNFAYELCLRSIEEEQLQELDLSCWEIAMVGAEPVRSDTLENFSSYFKSCGFRKTAFYPSYGLAEATLFVTGGPKSNPPVQLTLERAALEKNQLLPVEPSASLSQQTLVSCGQITPAQQVVIVNPETNTLSSSKEIGEIWIAGPSVTQGYWQQPQTTAETFYAYLKPKGREAFLRTGDLGFIWNGELFVTGRYKDIIILAGRNYYPQDIESIAEHSHPALRLNCGAAFSVDFNGDEHLVIVQELSYGPKPDLSQVIGNIQKEVARVYGIFASAIVIVKPGSIPKTSSGKIKRRNCKQLFLTNQLDILHFWQKQDLQGQKRC